MISCLPEFLRQGTALEIGMLLYLGFTMLDLVGPMALHSNVHLLWKTLEPVNSDTNGVR
jgi:hypothetical protein